MIPFPRLVYKASCNMVALGDLLTVIDVRPITSGMAQQENLFGSLIK